MTGRILKMFYLCGSLPVFLSTYRVQKQEACSKRAVFHKSFLTPGQGMSVGTDKNFKLMIHCGALACHENKITRFP